MCRWGTWWFRWGAGSLVSGLAQTVEAWLFSPGVGGRVVALGFGDGIFTIPIFNLSKNKH